VCKIKTRKYLILEEKKSINKNLKNIDEKNSTESFEQEHLELQTLVKRLSLFQTSLNSLKKKIEDLFAFQ
jgi:hypothetical protein